jgi:hypothetical protein
MMRFGDSYAKQIEKKKKVLEVLTLRIEDVQKRIEDYRRDKQKAPKSNAGKHPFLTVQTTRACRRRFGPSSTGSARSSRSTTQPLLRTRACGSASTPFAKSG